MTATMRHTLWRNDVLLGGIAIPLPSRGYGVYGMFVPSEAFTDIRPLMQHREPVFPGRPVFQHSFETSPGAKRYSRGDTTGVVVPLRKLTEEEARGLPREQILEIREDGAPLDLQMISIMEFPIPPADVGSEIHDACRAAGVSPSPWLLAGFAGREPRS